MRTGEEVRADLGEELLGIGKRREVRKKPQEGMGG